MDLDFKSETIQVNGVAQKMRTFLESDDGDVSLTDVLLQDYLDSIDPAFSDEDCRSSENNDGPILEDSFAEILESKYDNQ